MKRIFYPALIFVGVSFGAASDAMAYSCPFSTFSEDLAVRAAAPPAILASDWVMSLSPPFQGYLVDSSWDSWRSSPSVTNPAGKMSDGWFLLTNGQLDTWVGWHPVSQFVALATPYGSRFHNDEWWWYDDTNAGALASAAAGTDGFSLNHTKWKCPLFGNNSSNNNATLRAESMAHEPWHLWLHDHGWDPSHQVGPKGQCTAAGSPGACDNFYPHRTRDYLPGTASGGDLGFASVVNGVGVLFHSPYQIGAESLCDLATWPAAWVPIAVVTNAQNTANNRLANNFVNAASWTCGAPLPF